MAAALPDWITNVSSFSNGLRDFSLPSKRQIFLANDLKNWPGPLVLQLRIETHSVDQSHFNDLLVVKVVSLQIMFGHLL